MASLRNVLAIQPEQEYTFCNLSRAMCLRKVGQLSGGELALDAACLLNQIRVSVFENRKLFFCISFNYGWRRMAD